ncbi:hypothetical protein O0544_01980 [Edwardsiella anguillarum]|nr:hypothetical protein [Edwardsiella anguillarum]
MAQRDADAPSPRSWLPQALQSEPGLQAIWQSSGDLLLRGHCQESGRLAALRQRLQASGIHLQQEAVCNDTLRQALRALLNSYGYQNMIITLQDNGDAAIDGDFQGNSAPWPRRWIGCRAWDAGSLRTAAHRRWHG